jgi:hypothetical protein
MTSAPGEGCALILLIVLSSIWVGGAPPSDAFAWYDTNATSAAAHCEARGAAALNGWLTEPAAEAARGDNGRRRRLGAGRPWLALAAGHERQLCESLLRLVSPRGCATVPRRPRLNLVRISGRQNVRLGAGGETFWSRVQVCGPTKISNASRTRHLNASRDSL